MTSIDYALRCAAELPYSRGQQRIYSVALNKQGRIIAESENSYVVTHPTQAMYAKQAGLDMKVFLHSEIRTIIKCKGKEIDKLIVARVNSKGEPMDACPCVICRLAIKDAGIKTVEFSVGG